MEIERINDYTLKFFITYRDIEKRGFDREEIWYNRDRGEELFWEMMDEAHYQESFSLEGPLWIQVQALEKGLEIIVTRAQLSKDGSKLELPISNDKHLDIPLNDSFDGILEEQYQQDEDQEMDDEDQADDEEGEVREISFLFTFKDFEDLISLSHQLDEMDFYTKLFSYNEKYYLYVTFSEDMADADQDNLMSHILEFGFETGVSVHKVEEYGKTIIENNALAEIKKHFDLK